MNNVIKAITILTGLTTLLLLTTSAFAELPGTYGKSIAHRRAASPGADSRKQYFHQHGKAQSAPFKVGQMIYHGTEVPHLIKKYGLKPGKRTNGPDDRGQGVAWVTTDPSEAGAYAGSYGKILQRKATIQDVINGEASLNDDGPGAAALHYHSNGWVEAPQHIQELRAY